MASKRDFKLIAGGKSKKKGKKRSYGVSMASEGKRKGDPSGAGEPFGGSNIGFVIFLLVLGLIVGGGLFLVSKFRVKNIMVEGNVHYTQEEITDLVLTDELSYNSLYLSFKYRNRQIKDIPFIETMSVSVVSPDTIKIIVYEKTVAGYVEYQGRFMYFDRDGIVVESSDTRTMGVPQVTGIQFDHVVLYEPLPVEDPSIFMQILSITQVLSKYDISTDKIYFNENNEITLYFGQVRARLGSDDLEEKVMRLQYILPHLEEERGVLEMENYTDESQNITFTRDE